MKKLVNKLNNYSHNKSIRFAGILVVISVLLLENPWLGQMKLREIANTGMIDMNVYISPPEIYNNLLIMTTKGRTLYTILLLFDLLIIFSFTNLLVIFFLRIKSSTNLSASFNYLVFIPVARGLADLIENALLHTNIQLFPSLNKGLLLATSIAISLKWFLFALTALIFIYLIIVKKKGD